MWTCWRIEASRHEVWFRWYLLIWVNSVQEHLASKQAMHLHHQWDEIHFSVEDPNKQTQSYYYALHLRKGGHRAICLKRLNFLCAFKELKLHDSSALIFLSWSLWLVLHNSEKEKAEYDRYWWKVWLCKIAKLWQNLCEKAYCHLFWRVTVKSERDGSELKIKKVASIVKLLLTSDRQKF